MIAALWALAGSMTGTLLLYRLLDRVLKRHGDPRLHSRVHDLEAWRKEMDERLDQIEGAMRLLPKYRR